LWFVREFQDDLPCGQRCYIDWNVAGGTTFDNLQKEYQWRVCLLLPMCDGEIRDDEVWEEAAEIDYNQYLGDIFKDEEVENEVENENHDADFGYGYLGDLFEDDESKLLK
jgi:hypothetical protein